MKPYDAYKESQLSWLGTVPKHWVFNKAKFIFNKMERPIREEDDVITAFRDGAVTLRTNRRTEGFTISIKEIGYQGIRKGDLVIHEMDGFAGAIGVSDSDGKSTPVYSVCTPRKEASTKYYAYLLRMMAYSGFIQSLAKGIRERSSSFSFNIFQELELPYFPLTEQQAIADFLDRKTAQIDTLIAKKQRQIDLLQEQRTALINQAVTKGLNPSAPMKDSGVEWLGEIPSHWEMSKLKYLVTKIGSGVTPRGGAETYQESGIPFIRSQNVHFDGLRLDDIAYISEEVHSSMSNSAVRPNDVLINITGASIGRCTYIPSEFGEANVNQHVCVLRSNKKMNYQFLNLVLSSTIGQTQVWLGQGGAAREGLNYSNLGNFFIPLPPHDEQIDIIENVSKRLSQIDTVRKQVQELITKYQEYRTALISEAVTGKIDVRTAG